MDFPFLNVFQSGLLATPITRVNSGVNCNGMHMQEIKVEDVTEAGLYIHVSLEKGAKRKCICITARTSKRESFLKMHCVMLPTFFMCSPAMLLFP